jgi:hypothetical protein
VSLLAAGGATYRNRREVGVTHRVTVDAISKLSMKSQQLDGRTRDWR